MRKKISIESNGIKKTLKSYDEYKAILEYIWNGYDAGAKKINILLNYSELGRILDIKIVDDGSGINYSELEEKFNIFYFSQKKVRQNIENTHGKNGVGRFTFFKFSSQAKWETVYFDAKDGENKEYIIEMEENSLHEYANSNVSKSFSKLTGTTVSFTIKDGINLLEEVLKKELTKEFALYLELKSKEGIELSINNEVLDMKSNIFIKKEEYLSINKINFRVNFIVWKDKITEASKYYYIGSQNSDIISEHTKFNRKSDNFNHSIFIESDYFNGFRFEKDENLQNSGTLYITNSNKDPMFKEMALKIGELLIQLRKEFLKKQAKPVLEKYKRNGAFPKYGTNIWDLKREEELYNFVEELYIMEPKIFSSLNTIQQKTFIKLLGLVMDSDERNSIFGVLDTVVELKDDDRKELADILERTPLQNIINTIKIIEDRYKAVEYLKKLVYDKELKTYEVEHIQKFVENHFWIFGDEYHLITAAEPKFKQAVEKYWLDIKGEERKIEINHPNSKKEMDIFLCCKDIKNDRIRNIVVELKRPSVNLGTKEYRQIEDYKGVISSVPEFNASNEEWIFILVGRDFVNDNFIESKYKSAANHGEKFLTEKSDNYKIYVKKWSEVIAEFEMKHNFLNEKLKIQRDFLIKEIKDPTQIIEETITNNSAKVG